MRFCSQCGQQLAEGVRFCSGCGTPVAAVPPPPPVGAPPTAATPLPDPPAAGYDPVPAAGSPTRRRLPWIWLVGLGAALVATALIGAFVLTRLGTGGGSEYSAYWGEVPLAKPVTDEPESVWSWQPPEGDELSVVVDDGGTYASYWTGDGTAITALDDDGEERWTIRQSDGLWASRLTPDGSTLLLSPYESEDSDGDTLQAISTDDGSTRWTVQAGYPIRVGDDGVLVQDGDRVRMLDLDDGEEEWRAAAGLGWAAGPDLIFAAEGSSVSALDLSTGEEQWSVSLPVDVEDDYLTLAAAEGILLVSGGGEAVALGTDDGEQLWSETLDDDQSIGSASRDLVYIETSADSEEYVDGEVELYDASGRRGQLTVDVDDGWFYPSTSLTTGGTTYLVDSATGDVFDGDLARVGTFPGTLTAVGGGLYSLDGSELAYYELDKARRVWGTMVSHGDESQVFPTDGAVLLVGDGRITRYE